MLEDLEKIYKEKYRIVPESVKLGVINSKNIKINGDGLHVKLNSENEETIRKKLMKGEYILIYIGSFSVSFGQWYSTWYNPISVYTTDISRQMCEEEFGGIKIEGLCFQLKYDIGVWTIELLITRDDEPRLFKPTYTSYQFFEIAPSKS